MAYFNPLSANRDVFVSDELQCIDVDNIEPSFQAGSTCLPVTPNWRRREEPETTADRGTIAFPSHFERISWLLMSEWLRLCYICFLKKSVARMVSPRTEE